VLQVNCVIVRGTVETDAARAGEGPITVIEPGAHSVGAETFVIDSPVLPDELDALPAVLEQARFPAPSGLLATHGDWDHLLGRLAFPGLALGCAESTVERLRAAPGQAQRQLREFDEDLMIERPRPLALGDVQALPVPGHCAIGGQGLELHPTEGHTRDGMACVIPWAKVLVVGDYLSTIELPILSESGSLERYLETLERLRPLVGGAEHVVVGHGPLLDGVKASVTLQQDIDYLRSLGQHGKEAELPPGRDSRLQRRIHLENAAHSSA
jgi:glyoxylase-like metal-dependent hydrolase (beta-lactamase superfamily II)